MNVFLDTTTLYNDPYFRSNYNRLLLDSSKKHAFKIYISDVVIRELRKQLERSLEKFNKQIKSSIRSVSGNCKAMNNYTFDTISIETELIFFDDFYNNISSNGDVIIIDYEEEESVILSKIIDRAINRQKPFKENGEGFKDALIWESYINYAQYREMKNCIFISANVRDFAKSDYKNSDSKILSIHEDLLNEFPYFLKLYKDSQDFIKSEELKTIRKDAPYWLGARYQDEEQLYDTIFSKKHYAGYLEGSAKKFILNNDILDKEGIDFVNYIEITSITINEFEIVGFQEYENIDGIGCMIDLRIQASVDMDLYFNKSKERLESQDDLKFIDIFEHEFVFEASSYVDKDFNDIDVFQIDATSSKK